MVQQPQKWVSECAPETPFQENETPSPAGSKKLTFLLNVKNWSLMTASLLSALFRAPTTASKEAPSHPRVLQPHLGAQTLAQK